MSRLATREAITPTNQSPVFLIVTWISQATVLLMVGVKVLLSHTSTGIHADDWYILAAAALSVAQVVAVSFQGINGIGKVQASLSPHELDVYEKAAYSAEILYILTLVASKLSVVVFLYQITPSVLWRRVMAFVGVLTAMWGFSSVFAIAFQCRGPRRWELLQSQCFDRTAFWTVNFTFNFLIELALILVPFAMFFVLITSKHKRLILMICFSLRFSVVAVVAVQLYYLHHPVHPPGLTNFNYNEDFTFSTWPVFLTAQIIQSLSIVATCVPFMRNLFLGLETGMIQTGRISRRKIEEVLPHVWNHYEQQSSFSSIHLSGRHCNPNTAAATNLALSNWSFETTGTESTPLFDSGHPASSSDSLNAVHWPERLPDVHSRVPPAHTTLPYHGGEITNPPGLEYSYSRRQVSMIVEEDEDDDNEKIEYPETALDARILTGRMSL